MIFNISHVTPVLFGEGSSLQAGDRMAGFGCKKVLAVYDQGVKNAGITDTIIKSLRGKGIEIAVFDGVKADPPDTVVDAAAEMARRENIDGVIGIGGGSTMDTAKAINLLIANPGTIRDYLGGPNAKRQFGPGKCLVLVPTTAGTGSEVTRFIVVTDTSDENRKKGIRSSYVNANLAIVDPVLTVGMPPAITADTGMDVYAHAVEAIMGTDANPMSDLLGEKAISMVFKYLPKAVKKASDMEARTGMSYAATLAGYAFNDSLTHMGHSLGHTIGSIFHVPHGNACGVTMPEIIEYLAKDAPGPIARIAKAMGLRFTAGTVPEEVASMVADKLAAFNMAIGQKTLKELGVKKEDLEKIAQRAFDEGMWTQSPRKPSPNDMLSILTNAYKR